MNFLTQEKTYLGLPVLLFVKNATKGSDSVNLLILYYNSTISQYQPPPPRFNGDTVHTILRHTYTESIFNMGYMYLDLVVVWLTKGVILHIYRAWGADLWDVLSSGITC